LARHGVGERLEHHRESRGLEAAKARDQVRETRVSLGQTVEVRELDVESKTPFHYSPGSAGPLDGQVHVRADDAENEPRRFRRADLADFERERSAVDDQGPVVPAVPAVVAVASSTAKRPRAQVEAKRRDGTRLEYHVVFILLRQTGARRASFNHS
jgi:hypothetical protein